MFEQKDGSRRGIGAMSKSSHIGQEHARIIAKSGTEASYPERKAPFYIRYSKALLESPAMREVGATPVSLVLLIAAKEDSLFYSKPPEYWRSELIDRLGYKSPRGFQNARDKAMAAGLLYYRKRGRVFPGQYWVLVPPWLESKVQSGSSTNSDNRQAELVNRQFGCRQVPKVAPQTAPRKAPNNAPLSIPSNLKPILVSLAKEWNSVAEEVQSKRINVDRLPNLLIERFCEACQEPRVLSVVKDPSSIIDAAKKSAFCHGKTWFNLPQLFVRNKDNKYTLLQLIEGAYLDGDIKSRTRRRSTDSGKYDKSKPVSDVWD